MWHKIGRMALRGLFTEVLMVDVLAVLVMQILGLSVWAAVSWFLGRLTALAWLEWH